jgi:hypothetical protein
VKTLLFILAVAFGLLALATRKHLNRELDPDDDRPQVEESIRTSETANQNLNDALNRITGAQRPQVFQRPAINGARPPAVPPTAANPRPAPPTALSGEVAGLVKQMSENPAEAASILERGLSMTTTPESQQLRLSLFEAALNIPANEALKDPALRELTSTVVDPQEGPVDPDSLQATETKRQIVSSAYKLFLNTTKDAESAYAETTRVLDYQRDQATKDLLIYDCLTRYPELRARMLPNQ